MLTVNEQRELFILFRLWKSDKLTRKEYSRYNELLEIYYNKGIK